MKKGTIFAATALGQVMAAQEYGITCVSSTLIEMFDLINELRQQTTQSTIYSALVDARTQYEDTAALEAPYFILQDNTRIYMDYGIQSIIDVIDEIDAVPISTDPNIGAVDSEGVAVPPMKWSEGLALAAFEFTTDWITSNDLEIPSTGTLSTATRSQSYGTPVDPKEYTVVKAPNVQMTGQDALLILLIADGEFAAFTFAGKLMDAEYTVIGAALTVDTHEPYSPPKVMLDVMIDKSYRNKQFTPVCQVYPDFGGGTCNPLTDEDEAIFTYINQLRTDPGNQIFEDTLNDLAASFLDVNNPLVSTYDYYGTGSEINRSTQDGVAAVNEAIAYLTTKKNEAALDYLSWSPGLYHASVDHGLDIVNENNPTVFGRDGSLPRERATLYGDLGDSLGNVKQYQHLGRDANLMIVMSMLIDDGDSDRTRREEIFNYANSQLGLSRQNQSLYGSSTVFMFGRVGYVTDEPYSFCASPIIAQFSPDGATDSLIVSNFFEACLKLISISLILIY